jgi:lipoprotein NlpI
MNRKQRRLKEKNIKSNKQSDNRVTFNVPSDDDPVIDKKYKQAMVFLSLERIDKAAELFAQIIKYKPDHIPSLENLANISLQLKKFDNAINIFKAITELSPDYAIGFSNLAFAYREAGKIDMAKNAMNKAYKLNPNDEKILAALGRLYTEIGEKEHAQEFYESAYKKGDVLTITNYLNHQFKFSSSEHPYFKDLLSKDKKSDLLTESERISLYYTLSKAYKDLKQYKVSFEYLLKGSQLKRQSFNYAVSRHLNIIKGAQQYYTKELIEKHKDKGSDDDRLVFIVGMPRSGSTLLDRILSSHKDVVSVGEHPTLPLVMLNHAYMTPFNSVRFPTEPHSTPRMGPPDIRNRYLDDVEEFLRSNPKKQYTKIVDKALINYAWLGMIKIMFPHAKIVHTTRNPLDCSISCLSYMFADNQQLYTYDLKELGQVFRAYLELMEYWHNEFPGYIYDISYEDVIEDQESETRALLDFLELPWDENCLEFYKSKSHVKTASYAQVQNPIYKTSSGKWKNYIKFLGPLLEELGPFAPQDALDKFKDTIKTT